ncbi:MAG: TolC family protein [Planctomycetales bacterium]|nr:TolC family protein [Planctomycetales bacterium]
MQDAWSLALQGNHRLRASRWRVSAAQHHVGAARSARFPDIDLEAAYALRSDQRAFVAQNPGLAGLGSTLVIPYQQQDDVSLRALASVPLFTGGRIQNGIAAAESGVEARRLGRAQLEQEMKMTVAESFIGVLRAQRARQVAQATQRSLSAHFQDVNLSFSQGMVPRTDLLAAQVALSNARQRSLAADRQLQGAWAIYNRQLVRDLETIVPLQELHPDMVHLDLHQLTDRARRQRAEISTPLWEAEALEHRAVSLRRTGWPQLSLQGGYAYQENRFQQPQDVAEIGVGLQWNPYDGGRRRHEAEALLLQAKGLRELSAANERRAALEVRLAWLDIQETRQRVLVTQEIVQQAEENLRAARQRFTAGTGTNTEALDAEAARTQSLHDYYDATYAVVLASLRLRRATHDL